VDIGSVVEICHGETLGTTSDSSAKNVSAETSPVDNCWRRPSCGRTRHDPTERLGDAAVSTNPLDHATADGTRGSFL
jgi:hypothetical protein